MPHEAFNIIFVHALTGTIYIMCEFATLPNAKIPQKQFTSMDFRYFFYYYSFCIVAALMICIDMQTLYPSAYCVICRCNIHSIKIQIIRQYEL